MVFAAADVDRLSLKQQDGDRVAGGDGEEIRLYITFRATTRRAALISFVERRC